MLWTRARDVLGMPLLEGYNAKVRLPEEFSLHFGHICTIDIECQLSAVAVAKARDMLGMPLLDGYTAKGESRLC